MWPLQLDNFTEVIKPFKQAKPTEFHRPPSRGLERFPEIYKLMGYCSLLLVRAFILPKYNMVIN